MGALTAVSTAIGALIKYWESKKKQIIDYDKKSKVEIIKKIESSVGLLELQTSLALNKIGQFEIMIKNVTNAFEQNRTQLLGITKSLKEYIDGTSKRLKYIETTLSGASIKKIGEDTYLITPKKRPD